MSDVRKTKAVIDSVNTVIKGKDAVVRKVLAAIIAGGHILMEDIPGVGKTTLATAFARCIMLQPRNLNIEQVRYSVICFSRTR